MVVWGSESGRIRDGADRSDPKRWRAPQRREGKTKDILHLNIGKHARKDLKPLYNHSPAAALPTLMYILWSVRAGSVAVSTYDLARYLELRIRLLLSCDRITARTTLLDCYC